MTESLFAVKLGTVVDPEGFAYTLYNITRKGQVRGSIRRYARNLAPSTTVHNWAAYSVHGAKLGGPMTSLEDAKGRVAAHWSANPWAPGQRALQLEG